MTKFIYIVCVLFLLATQSCGKSLRRKTTRRSTDQQWTGKWFPDEWPGKWFPHNPNAKHALQPHKQSTLQECDDGKHSISVDYDPFDKRHDVICLTTNRTLYTPNLDKEPVLFEHFIPPAYRPPQKCLNETISYGETLPTFGAFRPLSPKFGTYRYLPPQRWLHSLAEGAIVMLYHPCAFPRQVKLLQDTLRGCLYRHLITPSLELTPERPLALVAWGKCLQMSVYEEHMVVQFIKDNAKNNNVLVKGAAQLYEADLLAEAHLVTDESDVEICGFKEM